MLTQEKRDEMLIRMDEGWKHMNKKLDIAFSKEGFARCQVHAAEVVNLKSSSKWFKRTGLLALAGVAGKYIYDFFVH